LIQNFQSIPVNNKKEIRTKAIAVVPWQS